MDGYTKREVAVLIGGVIVAVVLVIMATNYAIQRFVADPNDPLTKAGGLKPEQTLQTK
jgi:hypothetical protein